MINPNLFMYDDGRMEDTTGHDGLGIQMMGVEQNRLRRAKVMEQNREQQMQQRGFGPLRGLHDGLGLGPNPAWDGFFGAMQGKENAIQAQGGKFNFDERSFGKTKTEPLYNPMWDINQGQSSAVGEAYKDSRGNIGYRRRSGPVSGLMNSGR